MADELAVMILMPYVHWNAEHVLKWYNLPKTLISESFWRLWLKDSTLLKWPDIFVLFITCGTDAEKGPMKMDNHSFCGWAQLLLAVGVSANLSTKLECLVAFCVNLQIGWAKMQAFVLPFIPAVQIIFLLEFLGDCLLISCAVKILDQMSWCLLFLLC